MITENYLTTIKIKILTSPIIESFMIIKEKAILDQGYFRVILTLKNGDFCELSEFFKVQNQTCVTEFYRYQWMDNTKQKLRKRWDNVTHFPNLPNFPHHVHILEENNVYPSQSYNIIEILDCIEKELTDII